ncbi:MAG TPA: hypothetical protein VGU74_14440 [Gemmatimonadales bacterium]|nr:hypothetical protein [Gemmatimonadales bacterium]
MNLSGLRAVCLAVPLLGCISPAAAAQLIPIKTIPIAQGDQFQLFPSDNLGMGGVSIALPDSIGDPYVNPATTVRVRASRFFSSPTVYNLSHDAGGGRSLPFALLTRRGNWFGGLAIALQQVEPSRPPDQPVGVVAFNPPSGGGIGGVQTNIPGPDSRAHGNEYAFGSIGRTWPERNLSFGASVTWTGLHALDGVDLLYSGSRRIAQTGDALDLRAGALKEWPGQRGARSLEAIVFHNSFATTHDVLYADLVWDPGQQLFVAEARTDTNYDHTNTWGAQLQYEIPLATPGWRIGWLAIVNRATHPKIPNYDIANIAVIPRDPGTSYAYNLGIGLSKVLGPARFGVDAIYEPIRSHTWADASVPTVTFGGDTIAPGGKTIENHFSFSNTLLRIGVGRDVDLENAKRALGLQLGLVLRSISYHLQQTDHVELTQRALQTSWLEWTPTWGLSLRFPDLEIRYQGRVTKGAGRPGGGVNFVQVGVADMALSSGTILAAPSGPLSLVDVNTTTHQISLSLPLR